MGFFDRLKKGLNKTRENLTNKIEKIIIGYADIDEDLLDSYTLRVPRKEGDAAEFFIAKVKEGKMSQVEEKLEARKEAIAGKWKDNTDESMAYAKEPVILKNGNYIMLAVHADMDEAKAEFERLTKDK